MIINHAFIWNVWSRPIQCYMSFMAHLWDPGCKQCRRDCLSHPVKAAIQSNGGHGEGGRRAGRSILGKAEDRTRGQDRVGWESPAKASSIKSYTHSWGQIPNMGNLFQLNEPSTAPRSPIEQVVALITLVELLIILLVQPCARPGCYKKHEMFTVCH